MIKKFNIFINEDYKTGYFNYDNKPFKLDVNIDNKGNTKVKILYMDKYYEDLSVIIPDSKDLGDDEFYVNPKIDKEMIKILEKEGFIECTDKVSMCGTDKTISYKLV